MKIVIAVCTRQRPRMLADCLESLLAQQTDLPFSVLVVENDSEPAALPVVEEFARTHRLPIRHVLETAAGVANARNRALAEALQQGCDWLAFIDDDETAEPQWLAELMRVATEQQVDVVRGPVVYHYPPADRWAHLRDLGKGRRKPEGHWLKDGATNNVLMARRLFAADGLGLRFEPALNFTGGEDKLFFAQAFREGVRGVHAPTAVVHETVPITRCSLPMLYHDKARLAANHIRIERDFLGERYRTARYLKLLRRELKPLCSVLWRVPVALLARGNDDAACRRALLQAWLALARMHGILRGWAGKPLEGYRTVQGY